MNIDKSYFKINKRLNSSNEFDIVKLILASIVVLIHCSTLFNLPGFIFFQAIPAVPIFIFLSGLLVSESLLLSDSLSKYFLRG